MKKNYSSVLIRLFSSILMVSMSTSINAQATYTFNYTGASQTLAVMAGSYSVQCWGGNGGDNGGSNTGGNGGYSKGTITVTSPSTLHIYVGGRGVTGISSSAAGGFNGGGTSGSYSGYSMGSGGGASHIALATGVLSSLSGNQTAVKIVAGGGGGAGSNHGTANTQDLGGNGGGLTGGNGLTGGYGGTGGTQSAGGTGVMSNGTFGQGGNNGGSNTGGGGGGGWYGGGAAQWEGSGGGSGYIGGVTSGSTIVTGSTGFVTNPDISGHGKVFVTELCNITLSLSGVNSSNALCSGSTATLVTNAVGNYSWSTGATTPSLVISPNSTTIYSLTALSPSNCTSSAILTVVVNSAAPVITVGSNTTTTCLGKPIVLTASGAVTHTWTGGITNGVPFIPSATTSYTVTGTNGCGSTTSSITINVAPLPVGITAPTTVVCQYKPLSLTATGPITTYTWSPGALSFSSIVVNPGSNTIYTLSGSDGTCQGTATVAIVANPNPTITVVASSTDVCAGESVTLTANGANNYTWTNSSITGNSGVATPSVASMYNVVGSNQFNCTASGAQVVLVKPTPVMTAAANQNLICVGNSATLTVTGNADSYLWTTGSTTTVSIVSPNTTSTYSVTGTNTTTGCKSSQMVTVNVFQAFLPVSPSSTICEGASITLTAGAGTNFTWSPVPHGFFNITVKPAVPTTYTVSAKTTTGSLICIGTNTIHVGLYNKPVVTAQASRTVMCRTRESVTLTAGGAPNFVWINNNNNANAVIVFTTNLIQTHHLSVIGTDANGCQDTAVVSVKVDACTGLQDLAAEKLQVQLYPNPNNGSFTIRSVSAIRLEVSNELGQVVNVITLEEENNFSANLNGLAAGVYFLSGQHNGQRITEKIIVSK